MINNNWTTETYFNFSDDVYDEKSRYDNQDDWNVIHTKSGFENGESEGIQFRAYQNQETGDVIVAVRGSDNFGNWINDDRKLALEEHYMPYRDESQKFLAEVKQLAPNAELEITGHSLGGAVAQDLAMRNGLRATTFDAPGISKNRIMSVEPEVLDGISNYSGTPNVINLFGTQIGHQYYVGDDLEDIKKNLSDYNYEASDLLTLSPLEATGDLINIGEDLSNHTRNAIKEQLNFNEDGTIGGNLFEYKNTIYHGEVNDVVPFQITTEKLTEEVDAIESSNSSVNRMSYSTNSEFNNLASDALEAIGMLDQNMDQLYLNLNNLSSAVNNI
ncbi:MAG: hypothetical protein AB8G11_00500 [Saprospiraceae bacterium]